LNLVAVTVFMLVSGVEVRWTWLMLVPLLLLFTVFVAGIAMLLSALYVRFRDIRPIWDVALQVLFYGTPILYPIETVPEGKLRSALMCNPLASVVQEVRHFVIDPDAMTAAEVLGAPWRLVIPLGIVILTCVVGFWYFNRQAPQIAEEL
jgi:ABC-2 type transport system permease protein